MNNVAIQQLRQQTEGKRVRLVVCNDPYTNLPVGLLGTVISVDDVGTLHVKWDNGSNLGLCKSDGDRWEVIG